MPAVPAPLVLGPLLDALRGVKWPTRERVRAGLPGSHRANQRGTTGEFTEFRAYRQGDDPRRIDWRLLARSDRAFIRVTDERAWWPTWILVDASASMAFPEPAHAETSRRATADRPTNADKWTTARAMAVGLAAVVHATGDPVGLLVATRPEPRRLAPRTRRGTVQAIATALDSITPSGAAPLAHLLSRLPRGTRIVLCTDALGQTDALLSAMSVAGAAGSDVTLMHIVHPLELSPPAGAWQAIDPEADGEQRPFGADARPEYRRAFDRWRADVARRSVSAGARYHEVLCDEHPARAIRRLTAAALTGAPT